MNKSFYFIFARMRLLLKSCFKILGWILCAGSQNWPILPTFKCCVRETSSLESEEYLSKAWLRGKGFYALDQLHTPFSLSFRSFLFLATEDRRGIQQCLILGTKQKTWWWPGCRFIPWESGPTNWIWERFSISHPARTTFSKQNFLGISWRNWRKFQKRLVLVSCGYRCLI